MTTGQILAMAAFHDGKESQTFPMFGVERAGAPVQSFVRIDEKKIDARCQVYDPDIVLVLESSLLDIVDVTAGLKEGGWIVVNSNKKPEELSIKGNYKIHCVDATTIALDIFKRPIVNTPILGAFAAITKVVSLSGLKKAINDRFLASKGEHMADLNKQAVEKVYNISK